MKKIMLLSFIMCFYFNSIGQSIRSNSLPGHTQRFLIWEPVEEDVEYTILINKTSKLTGETTEAVSLLETTNNYIRIEEGYFQDQENRITAFIQAKNINTGETIGNSDEIEIATSIYPPNPPTIEKCNYKCRAGGFKLSVYEGCSPLLYGVTLETDYTAFQYYKIADYIAIFGSSQLINATILYNVSINDKYCDRNGYKLFGTVVKVPYRNVMPYVNYNSASNLCELGTVDAILSHLATHVTPSPFPYYDNVTGVTSNSYTCPTDRGCYGYLPGNVYEEHTNDWIDDLFGLDIDILFDDWTGSKGSHITNDGVDLFDLTEAFYFEENEGKLKVFENDFMLDFNKNDFIQSIELRKINDFSSEQFVQNISVDEIINDFPNGMYFEVDMVNKPYGLYQIRINPINGASVQYLFANETTENLNRELIVANNLNIYPSPTEDSITLKFTDMDFSKSIQVQILDFNEIEIYNKQIVKNNHVIDMKEWKSGYYVCRISIGKEVYIKKVLKN